MTAHPTPLHDPAAEPDPAADSDQQAVVIGLLADPGLPSKIAGRLAEDLPGALAEQVSDEVRWTIEVVHEAFEVASDHDRVIDNARARVTGTDWDAAVCITDMPMETSNGRLVADVSLRDRVALMSLPALGGIRLRRRARDVAVTLIDELMTPDAPADHTRPAPISRLARRMTPADGVGDIDVELVMPGAPGAVRLLAGTVRVNQPWQLAVGLSTALAGAATGSAFGILYSAIWKLGTALEPWRLVAGTTAAIAVLAVWLVAGHGLWQPRRSSERLGALLNTATLLTVLYGVLVFYGALLVLNLGAAALIIPPHYFGEVIGRPVGLTDYLRVALMASGMGTIAGAVGSGLEDDDTVRRAAYSTREQQRRAQRDG